MELQSLNADALTNCIRRKYQHYLTFMIFGILVMLIIGIVLTVRFGIFGAVIGTVLLAIALYAFMQVNARRMHPENADVFRKYGTPETVAEILRKGSSDVFFDNGRLVVTEQYMLDISDPETLLIFPNALTVYPDGVQGKEEYLVVYDKWGKKLRYPFTNGKQQVMKSVILIDKVRKNAPGCRCGHRPEDMEYVRKNQI